MRMARRPVTANLSAESLVIFAGDHAPDVIQTETWCATLTSGTSVANDKRFTRG
jgi:hypothetical protein